MDDEMNGTAPATGTTATAVAEAAPVAATETAAPVESTTQVDPTEAALGNIESIQKELGLLSGQGSDYTVQRNEDGSETWVYKGDDAPPETPGGSTAQESESLSDEEVRAILQKAGIDPALLDKEQGEEVDPRIQEYEVKLKQEQQKRLEYESELLKHQKAEALKRGDLFFGEPESFKKVYAGQVEPKINGFTAAVPEIIGGLVDGELMGRFNDLIQKDEFTVQNMSAAVEEFKKGLSAELQGTIKAVALGASLEAMKGVNSEAERYTQAQQFNQRVESMWHSEYNAVAQKLAEAGVAVPQEVAVQATELLNDLIMAGRTPEDAIQRSVSYAKSLITMAIKAGEQSATLAATSRAAATVASTGGQQVPVADPNADWNKMIADPNVPLSKIENLVRK
jgi:hypothetical protein